MTLPSPFVTYTVRVEAVDAAGNRSGAASVRVVSLSLFGFSPQVSRAVVTPPS